MDTATELSPLLLVDDNQKFVAKLTDFFARKRIRVVQAYKGVEALSLVTASPPGTFKVMLSDINMETETAGLDVLPEVRKHDPNLPVIYLSGYGNEQRADRTIRAGAVLMLDKPTPAQVLYNCVFCLVLYAQEQRRAMERLVAEERRIQQEREDRLELAMMHDRMKLVSSNLFNHNMKNIAFTAQAYLQSLSPQPPEVTKALRCLDGIVDQTLKLQAMSVEPDAGDVTDDLAAVVDQTRDELRGQARFTDPARQLVFRANGSIPPVHIEQDVLATLVGELAYNAVAHNTRPVHIAVTATATNGHVEIRVADDGDGVRADRVDGLFQVDPGRKEHGYGLPYSYQVARTHRGDLTYDAPNKAFVLTLPVHAPGGTADA
jgi:CheY-like chemotaxis protein